MRIALFIGLIALLMIAGPAPLSAQADQPSTALEFLLDRDQGGRLFIRVHDVSLGESVGDALLDTGAERSSISARFADGSGLVEARRVFLNTYSGKLRAFLSRPAPIRVQEHYRTRSQILIMPPEITWPTDRLLASSSFPSFSIDFDNSIISVPGSIDGMTPLPGGKRDGVFFVEVRGVRRTHRFIVDTGSSGSRIRADSLRDLQGVGGVTSSLRQYLSSDGWQMTRGIARLSGLRVGDQRMPALTFRVVEADDISVRGFAGVLGLKNLLSLNWHFDNNSEQIWGHERDFLIDGSPLVGLYAFHKDDLVTVTGLIEAGAAYRAGLMIGDQIVTLNGLSPLGDSYRDYVNLGNCSCSDRYIFEIMRNDQPITLVAKQADLF